MRKGFLFPEIKRAIPPFCKGRLGGVDNVLPPLTPPLRLYSGQAYKGGGAKFSKLKAQSSKDGLSFHLSALSFQLIFLLLCLSSFVALASEPVDLGEVVVEGAPEKEKTPSLDRSAAATVLIPRESKQEAQTLPELLEESAGVHVRRYGGLDDFSSLSLRGSSSGQVQIYLDDIPLMTAQGAIADLGLVPMAAIGRAEVYRGGSPGQLPESTIGGVVVLKSRKKPDKREASIFGQIGSFETAKTRINYAKGGQGDFTPVLAYEYARSLGDFLYRDDNGTRFNIVDDTIVRRRNNAFESNSLFTKFLFDLPSESALSLTNIFFQKGEGIPGLGTRQSLNAHLTTWRNISSFALEKENLFTKDLSGHLDLFFDYWNSQFSDPDAEISLSPEDNDDKTYRFGSNLRAGYDIGSHQHLTAFVAQRSEYYVPYDRLASPRHGPESSRQTINAGFEEEIRLFRDRLLLVPSLRVENLFNGGSLATASEHQLSAKLGVSLRIVDELYSKSNVYRGFRNPTFAELFGNRGTLVGNPSLQPEKAVNIDSGLSYDFAATGWFDGGHIEATYYRHDVDRLIQFVQTSQFTAKPMNMNRAIIQGAETMASAKFLKRLRISLSYTYQQAKDHSGSRDTRGKYLPGRPRHELFAIAGWRESWLPWLVSDLFVDLRYMSGNYLDMQNLLQIQNRMILGSGISWEFVNHFLASFSVRNILNDRISDLVGYPLPGRSYWGSLDVKI